MRRSAVKSLRAVAACALLACGLVGVPAGAQATSPAPIASPAASPPPSLQAGAPMGVQMELPARFGAYVEGKASRDDIFAALQAAFGKVNAALGGAGLKASGHPLAVFLEASEESFKFRAMVPIEAIPDGKTALGDDVKLGRGPVGKAMRFEHRGAYEDIDGTYEAITAYLDEKSIEALDIFVEEYLNDVTNPIDPNLQVDIYVLLQ